MITEKEKKVYVHHTHGLSQKEIAQKLGISQPAVSKFYRNVVFKIADARATLAFFEEVKRQ